MPREAKLFSSSSGSAVRGFLKFRANIPPRWIKNARTSRKRVEPEIVRGLGALKRLSAHPRDADVTMVLVTTQGRFRRSRFLLGGSVPKSYLLNLAYSSLRALHDGQVGS
jgi:hypothetical protein